ncbi:MAG: DUF1566 domain-containing protein [Bacteroides sp.]
MGTEPIGCNTLYAGTGKKWRVPILKELQYMYTNKAAIKAMGGEAMSEDFYWSATENYEFNSWYVHFTYNETRNRGKTSDLRVRCVRDL